MSGLSSEELGTEVDLNEQALRIFVEQEVQLIHSLSADAYAKIAELVLSSVPLTPEKIVELQSVPDITYNRAALIARTESSRATSGLTEIQSRASGVPEYVWQTMRDDRVRHSHRLMQGVVCSWDDPPELSDGTVGHPGRFPNCRCWAEPVFSKFGEGFTYKRKRRQLRAT